MIVTAKILQYEQGELTVKPMEPIGRELVQKQIKTVEIRLDDGRSISADQRRKIFAIIRDISLWSGHEPEYLRQYLTWDFLSGTGGEWFSLSAVDRSTAREFITYLIEFCFYNSVPTKDTLLHETDDIGKYLYLCLEHRKCAVCNQAAEVHHVDRIGMGRDREQAVHIGLKAVALCRKHHEQAHGKEKRFFQEHHIYGIRLDTYLCGCLSLNTKNRK